VFASGGLDERDVARLLDAEAPVDGFGIGSRLGTVADSPYLDMAYKLVEFDGRPTLKLSPGKATLPGRKQVWRVTSAGAYARDVLATLGEEPPPESEALLRPVLEGGQRVWSETLDDARSRCASERERLPARHRSLAAEAYTVEVSPELSALRDRAEEEARLRQGLA
jgi:nicotinate phosphoribosyltransferase